MTKLKIAAIAGVIAAGCAPVEDLSVCEPAPEAANEHYDAGADAYRRMRDGQAQLMLRDRRNAALGAGGAAERIAMTACLNGAEVRMDEMLCLEAVYSE